MSWSWILIVISFTLAISSYFNGEKLRKRLNDLEDILNEKGLISKKDLIDKYIK